MTAPEPATEDNPWSIATLNKSLSNYIGKLGHIWIEGQLAQTNHRPGRPVSFANLRDLDQNKSIELTATPEVLKDHTDGDRVMVYGRPQFWGSRGTTSFRAREIRAVGIGDLRANLDKLKRKLYNEGLFSPARKKQLPKYPQLIGLITGKDSAAERDVLSVATKRWPHAKFEVRHVLVQGKSTVLQVTDQVRDLDNHPDVDVILIARGGGSFEDLLPFSSEKLIRVVADCQTPVISAIGHEPDNPLLDEVADLRGATPTDAAKRVVPDLWEEIEKISELDWSLDQQAAAALARDLDAVRDFDRRLDQVMRDPIAQPLRDIDALGNRIDLAITSGIDAAVREVRALDRRLDALGPRDVLERGYAVVQTVAGEVLTSADDALRQQDFVTIHFANGSVVANVIERIDVEHSKHLRRSAKAAPGHRRQARAWWWAALRADRVVAARQRTRQDLPGLPAGGRREDQRGDRPGFQFLNRPVSFIVQDK